MKSSQRLGVALLMPVLIILSLMLQPWWPGTLAWAQSKTPGSAPAKGAAPEIKVPQGTLDAITAILTRRSIRDYTPRPVPEDLINLLVGRGHERALGFQ